MQRAEVYAHVLLGLWLSLSSACTRDFSRFHFQNPRDGGSSTPAFDSGMDSEVAENMIDGAARDGMPEDARMSVDPQGGTGGTAPKDAGPMTMPKDASKPPIDARMPDPDDDARVSEDAQVPVDAQMPDAQKPDAHMPNDMLKCSDSYRALSDSRDDCRACTCNRCTTVALDCLAIDNAYERAACTNLWACAIEHGCRDWDCYCSTSACRLTMTAPGDGPCVSAMNDAAGGTREKVNAAHQANDPDSPLVRAIRAIGCTVGIPSSAVGGPITEQCKASCDKM